MKYRILSANLGFIVFSGSSNITFPNITHRHINSPCSSVFPFTKHSVVYGRWPPIAASFSDANACFNTCVSNPSIHFGAKDQSQLKDQRQLMMITLLSDSKFIILFYYFIILQLILLLRLQSVLCFCCFSELQPIIVFELTLRFMSLY